MKQVDLAIQENTNIADNVWRMVLKGDTSAISAPGQFINIALSGHFLRRPISVCDYDADSVTILYKIAGDGTKEMTSLPIGTKLDVLTGLGNGFDSSRSRTSGHALLLCGGIGSAPMLALCKKLISDGIRVSAVLGFNKASEIILADELSSLGASVIVMTMDGSKGGSDKISYGHGAAADADIDSLIGASDAYYYACGPLKMLRSIYQHVKCDGEISLEERMGCGFGACMGCSIHTTEGTRRVCKDGPVFTKSQLLWD